MQVDRWNILVTVAVKLWVNQPAFDVTRYKTYCIWHVTINLIECTYLLFMLT